MTAPTQLLSGWLDDQLDAQGKAWLHDRRQELAATYTDRALHITLGLAPRRVGKLDLALDAKDFAAIEMARSGWNPRWWSVADAARILVLLETAEAGNEDFSDRFVDLCCNADMGELISFYRGLALYPNPETLTDQAAEGLRTNIRSVFEAVAHNNPFPKEQFSVDRWNQMVLKAMFIGSTLAPIQGLDERANEELARILCDFAHERWAAHRQPPLELWRCVAPFAEGAMMDDLRKVVTEGSEAERRAGALALTMCPNPQAAQLLAQMPELKKLIDDKAIDWDRIE